MHLVSLVWLRWWVELLVLKLLLLHHLAVMWVVSERNLLLLSTERCLRLPVILLGALATKLLRLIRLRWRLIELSMVLRRILRLALPISTILLLVWSEILRLALALTVLAILGRLLHLDWSTLNWLGYGRL